MSQTETYDLVIVGGGPGGLTAGIYAMRAVLKTVLIEKGTPGGQVAINKPVENYPGFVDIIGFDLCDKYLEHARRYGLEIRQHEVVAVEPGPVLHKVHLAGGEVMQCHALILATGGIARKLNVPGEVENLGSGVSYCATCDGFFFKDKTVVVVGGGDTALEEALFLAKITNHVYLIHRRETFRASKILEHSVLNDPKIEVVFNTVVSEIKSNSNGVHAIAVKNTHTGDERDIVAEGIFIFVGFSPNNSLVPAGIDISPEGYVMTDEKCETNISGIFAIGDLRKKFANQIVIAAADGCTAALAAARHMEMTKASLV